MLTFLAGLLNGGLLLIAGSSVSHHTGNITRLALKSVQGTLIEALSILLLPVAFYSGACISGLLFHNRNFMLSKRYGTLLMFFSALFFMIAIIQPSVPIVLALTCGILGMQNGMFIFYKGILIRTTHFTGYLTDAGLALGMVLRGKREELQRCLFYLSGIICFCIGGFAALFIHTAIFFYTVSCLYLLIGIFYFVFRTIEDH